MDKFASNTIRCCRSHSVRCFSTTVSTQAAPKAPVAKSADEAEGSTGGKGKGRASLAARNPFLADYDIRNLDEFRFDDATSLGWLRLEKIREAQELFRKVEVDREVLRAQARPFKTPSPAQAIRIRSTIDLVTPTSASQTKSVLIAPVSSLPLSDADSIQRLKLLAGPRWTPGYPGRGELEISDDEGREGWVKIAEERFKDGRANRRSAGEMLERLVDAANDEKSPLSASTPLDPRHYLARQGKKKQRSAGHMWQRAAAMKARPDVVGGVKGFPKEWLSADA